MARFLALALAFVLVGCVNSREIGRSPPPSVGIVLEQVYGEATHARGLTVSELAPTPDFNGSTAPATCRAYRGGIEYEGDACSVQAGKRLLAGERTVPWFLKIDWDASTSDEARRAPRTADGYDDLALPVAHWNGSLARDGAFATE